MSNIKKVLLKRSNTLNKVPSASQLNYGELAVNYKKGNEKLYIKNDNDEIVDLLKTTSSGGSATIGDEIYIEDKSNNSYTRINGKLWTLSPIGGNQDNGYIEIDMGSYSDSIGHSRIIPGAIQADYNNNSITLYPEEKSIIVEDLDNKSTLTPTDCTWADSGENHIANITTEAMSLFSKPDDNTMTISNKGIMYYNGNYNFFNMKDKTNVHTYFGKDCLRYNVMNGSGATPNTYSEMNASKLEIYEGEDTFMHIDSNNIHISRNINGTVVSSTLNPSGIMLGEGSERAFGISSSYIKYIDSTGTTPQLYNLQIGNNSSFNFDHSITSDGDITAANNVYCKGITTGQNTSNSFNITGNKITFTDAYQTYSMTFVNDLIGINTRLIVTGDISAASNVNVTKNVTCNNLIIKGNSNTSLIQDNLTIYRDNKNIYQLTKEGLKYTQSVMLGDVGIDQSIIEHTADSLILNGFEYNAGGIDGIKITDVDDDTYYAQYGCGCIQLVNGNITGVITANSISKNIIQTAVEQILKEKGLIK